MYLAERVSSAHTAGQENRVVLARFFTASMTRSQGDGGSFGGRRYKHLLPR